MQPIPAGILAQPHCAYRPLSPSCVTSLERGGQLRSTYRLLGCSFPRWLLPTMIHTPSWSLVASLAKTTHAHTHTHTSTFHLWVLGPATKNLQPLLVLLDWVQRQMNSAHFSTLPHFPQSSSLMWSPPPPIVVPHDRHPRLPCPGRVLLLIGIYMRLPAAIAPSTWHESWSGREPSTSRILPLPGPSE